MEAADLDLVRGPRIEPERGGVAGRMSRKLLGKLGVQVQPDLLALVLVGELRLRRGLEGEVRRRLPPTRVERTDRLEEDVLQELGGLRSDRWEWRSRRGPQERFLCQRGDHGRIDLLQISLG